MAHICYNISIMSFQGDLRLFFSRLDGGILCPPRLFVMPTYPAKKGSFCEAKAMICV